MDVVLNFCTSIEVINEVKSFISKCLDVNDLGEVDVIRKIKLIKDESGITTM